MWLSAKDIKPGDQIKVFGNTLYTVDTYLPNELTFKGFNFYLGNIPEDMAFEVTRKHDPKLLAAVTEVWDLDNAPDVLDALHSRGYQVVPLEAK